MANLPGVTTVMQKHLIRRYKGQLIMEKTDNDNTVPENSKQKKHWSKIPNENQTISCENEDCNRTDRPLYVWHGENGKDSILLCDICILKTMTKPQVL